jgi:hypothetical protein
MTRQKNVPCDVRRFDLRLRMTVRLVATLITSPFHFRNRIFCTFLRALVLVTWHENFIFRHAVAAASSRRQPHAHDRTLFDNDGHAMAFGGVAALDSLRSCLCRSIMPQESFFGSKWPVVDEITPRFRRAAQRTQTRLVRDAEKGGLWI